MVVRFYGRLAEELTRELTLKVSSGGLSVGALRSELAERFGDPRLSDPAIKVVVQDEVAPDDRIVLPAEEVEFFALVSGG